MSRKKAKKVEANEAKVKGMKFAASIMVLSMVVGFGLLLYIFNKETATSPKKTAVIPARTVFEIVPVLDGLTVTGTIKKVSWSSYPPEQEKSIRLLGSVFADEQCQLSITFGNEIKGRVYASVATMTCAAVNGKYKLSGAAVGDDEFGGIQSLADKSVIQFRTSTDTPL